MQLKNKNEVPLYWKCEYIYQLKMKESSIWCLNFTPNVLCLRLRVLVIDLPFSCFVLGYGGGGYGGGQGGYSSGGGYGGSSYGGGSSYDSSGKFMGRVLP